MPKDDYFRIVYRLLNTLYEYMKKGLAANTEALSAKALGIEEGYRDQILVNLYDDGYIKGIRAESYFGGETEAGHLVIENVFPARAGVILPLACNFTSPACIPRASGGDPVYCVIYIPVFRYSPRERG